MTKGEKSTVSIGGVSILIILVQLCLTTFACTTMMSARANTVLTNQAAESCAAYYAADAAAEELLARIDTALIRTGAWTSGAQPDLSLLGPEDALSAIWWEADEIEYQLAIDQARCLAVRLRLADPGREGAPYIILHWKVIDLF